MANFKDELNKIRGEELQRIDEENKKKQFDIFTYFKDNVVPFLVKDELDAAMTALRDAAKENPNNKRIEVIKEIGKEAAIEVKEEYVKELSDLFILDFDKIKDISGYIKKGIFLHIFANHDYTYNISLINAKCLPEQKNELAEVFFEKLKDECEKNGISITVLNLYANRHGRRTFDFEFDLYSSKTDKLCLDCPHKCNEVRTILKYASTGGTFSTPKSCEKSVMITYAIDL